MVNPSAIDNFPLRVCFKCKIIAKIDERWKLDPIALPATLLFPYSFILVGFHLTLPTLLCHTPCTGWRSIRLNDVANNLRRSLSLGFPEGWERQIFRLRMTPSLRDWKGGKSAKKCRVEWRNPTVKMRPGCASSTITLFGVLCVGKPFREIICPKMNNELFNNV